MARIAAASVALASVTALAVAGVAERTSVADLVHGARSPALALDPRGPPA